jgi:hypothetical protein
MKDVQGIKIGIRGEIEVLATDLKYTMNDELFGLESSLADENFAILSSYEIFNMTNESWCGSIESFRGII